jgi:hypothetical protein
MKQVLRLERGCRCQICNKPDQKVGVFHIIGKGSHPRLRYNKENLLLCCWFPCHSDWHKNFYKAQLIEKKIIQLLGRDYKERLERLNAVSSKIDIKLTYFILKEQLKKLENGKPTE